MSPGPRQVTITVDGREIAAIEGEMLHDAARKGDVGLLDPHVVVQAPAEALGAST